MYVVIEKEIILNKELTATDKILYGFLCLFSSNSNNCCFMKNATISKETNISVREVQYSLARLSKYNYISIEYSSNRRKITPVILDYIKNHEKINNAELFDYDWLNEEE